MYAPLLAGQSRLVPRLDLFCMGALALVPRPGPFCVVAVAWARPRGCLPAFVSRGCCVEGLLRLGPARRAVWRWVAPPGSWYFAGQGSTALLVGGVALSGAAVEGCWSSDEGSLVGVRVQQGVCGAAVPGRGRLPCASARGSWRQGASYSTRGRRAASQMCRTISVVVSVLANMASGTHQDHQCLVHPGLRLLRLGVVRDCARD